MSLLLWWCVCLLLLVSVCSCWFAVVIVGLCMLLLVCA